ncbi:chalcone isomerase family protein [Phaeobacter sp.]|uniref:chalcone isomerase family protein n=1 Tax=Phaeobacter sp. TaxID=1902409 RepID=UPI0025D3438B|nr:chalcone isomerase family protein [Phaeobacter sp.]
MPDCQAKHERQSQPDRKSRHQARTPRLVKTLLRQIACPVRASGLTMGLTMGLMLGLFVSATSSVAAAQSGTGLSTPQKLGEVTFRWFGIPLYDASLFADGQPEFDWQRPLALELSYRRSFSQAQLMRATAYEIERIEGPRGDQAEFFAKLDGCFRDVAAGDRFVATSTNANQVALYLNGQQTCDVRHSDARKRFLNIWLSPESRSARLSRQLRGE